MAIDMTFNTYKTVCMIFSPTNKCKSIGDSFPQFNLLAITCHSSPHLNTWVKLLDDIDVQRKLQITFK